MHGAGGAVLWLLLDAAQQFEGSCQRCLGRASAAAGYKVYALLGQSCCCASVACTLSAAAEAAYQQLGQLQQVEMDL
jgi:hypothetical protein